MSELSFPIFEAFQDIKQLGCQKLQQLCEAWLETYVAKEFAISRVIVETIDSKLCLDFRVELTHQVQDREDYFFPADELLLYIADNAGFAPERRTALVRQIIAGRRTAGPNLFRRFTLNTGAALPLYINCKNPACGNVMQTPLTAYACETITDMEPEDIECPRCFQTYTFYGSDFHFEPGAQG